ncbi:MAG: DMT family transporter [Cytophagales bacterium]
MTNDFINFKKQSGFLIGLLLVLSGAVLFSIKAILIKKTYEIGETDAVSLLTLRMLFSQPFFLFTLLSVKKTEKLNGKNFAIIFGLGFIGYYVSSILDFSGLQYISASLERIILFTYPTFVVIVNRLFFKQKLNKIVFLALILTYLGISLSFIFEKIQVKDLLLGGGMVLLASFTYALYLVGTNRMVFRFGTIHFTSMTMTIATVSIFAHFLVTHSLIELFFYSFNTYFYSILMAVFCTVLPSFMISEGIRRIGSTNSAIVASVGPISTIILATIFLNEEIHWFQVFGGLLVVSGVTVISLFGKK